MAFPRLADYPTGITAINLPEVIDAIQSEDWIFGGITVDRTDRGYYSSVNLGAGSQPMIPIPVFKRRLIQSKAVSIPAHIVDFQQAFADKAIVQEFMGKILDEESGAYDTEGSLGRDARKQLESLLLNRGEKITNDLLKKSFVPTVPVASLYAICDALGRVQGEVAKSHALVFLTEMLQHSRAEARDAAVLGLSLLDDRKAVPALKVALEREKSVFLRETIDHVISGM